MKSPLIKFSIIIFLIVISGCSSISKNVDTFNHLEKCTIWDYKDNKFGTTNNCNEPVTIQFMLISNQVVERRDLKSGERFDTGLGRIDIMNGWIFATCPVNYSPDVPFLLENRKVLIPSKYNCVSN